MGEQRPKYWKSLEERDDPAFAERAKDEFAESPLALGRRDFLKAAGFSVALAAATGCARAPVQKALPLLNQPETIVPGRSLYYASTCGGCSAGCGVLVKVRDGRPIKLEGNPQHPVSRGGLCAVGQASVLGLYDSQRLKNPLKQGKDSAWEQVDREIAGRLQQFRSEHGAIRVLTGTIISPTLRAMIAKFLTQFPNARHVEYDPLSNSAILAAHEMTHGARVLPRYYFGRAEIIVSFDADFLGTWISPVEFTRDYRAGRDLEVKPARVSYHVQFEPRMSLTGSKADRRFAVAPGEMGAVLTALAQRVSAKAGAKFEPAALEDAGIDPAFLNQLAERLWRARGRSLVLCGSNDARQQVLANYLNHLLGNYGSTLDAERPSYQARGSDRELEALIQELNAGKVSALFVYDVNPVFDLPNGPKLAETISRVPLSVSLAERLDETAAAVQYVCPDHLFLESWSDSEPVAGLVAVTQPAIHPLHGTRAAIESFAAWGGNTKPAYDIIREHWRAQIFPRQTKEKAFETFWERTVHDGFAEVEPEHIKPKPFNVAAVQAIAPASQLDAGAFALVLYPKVSMLEGQHAYNPWLQELPDPITKTTWDNYACVSPAAAAKLGIKQGDVLRIQAAGAQALELPAYIQPGQHDKVVAVALGYGSRLTERFANIGPHWIDALPSVGDNGLVGQKVAPLLRLENGALRYDAVVEVRPTGNNRELACTQLHNTLTVPKKLAPAGSEPRPVVQETTLAAFGLDPHSGVEDHVAKEDLWPADHPYTGPRWGMVVDLNACTGCSACVIACQAENNIPVVGRDEIRRNREMHWLRIDRYYSEPAPGVVEVAHQPMSCQQCENAPCETVCPVLATVHTEDGLNAQVYNRCVGTRYCANNCPYKGRRFNWFAYSHDDRLQNLALNPDVTVRSRGVMEKCSFCVQRLQEAKIEAKRRGETVGDGGVQTACQQSCPARAIYFGDLNDRKSEVSRMMANPRRYRLLSELNVKPAVGYLTVVRNREETKERSDG